MKKIFITSLILLASGGFALAQAPEDLNSYPPLAPEDLNSYNDEPAPFSPSPQDGSYVRSSSFSTAVPVTNSISNNSGGDSGVRDLKSLIAFIIRYINEGILLLMALATIMFVYNVVMYFVVKTDGDRSEASKYLLYSIIGLAVIVSFWGIVNVVIKTFNLEDQRPNIQKLYF